MVSLTFRNRGVKYLLCAIDVFTRYTWVKRLKDKKAKIDLHGFIEIVNESKRKPNNLLGLSRKIYLQKLYAKMAAR